MRDFSCEYSFLHFCFAPLNSRFTVTLVYMFTAVDVITHNNNSNNRMADNDNKGSNRGFAAMDEDKQREIARKGGQSQGKDNNPGNFANDPERAAEAGRKGGQARGDNNSNNQ